MASTKLKDLAVKVGSYTDNQGQEKGRYENIGALMQSDDGNMFVMLKRTFNPAGVPGNADRDNILVSAFDPQQRNGQQSNNKQGGGYGSGRGGSGGGGRPDMDDVILFIMEWR